MKIKSGVKPSLPPVPGGTYLAVCVYSIAVGEQLCEFKDKGKTYNNQVMLGFELSGVDIEIDGKKEARTLGRTFNIAKSKNSALRKFVGAWQAREFTDEEFLELDTNDLVGKTAMLNVVLNESGEYANIEGCFQIPAGFPQPVPTLPLIRFDMEPWDQAAFEALPEWAQARVKKSTEWQKEHAPTDAIVAPGAAPGMPLQGVVNGGRIATAPPLAVPRNDGSLVWGAAVVGGAVGNPPVSPLQRGEGSVGSAVGGTGGNPQSAVPTAPFQGGGIPQSAPLTA
ncbi:MAG: hypothetical protein IJE22_00110, partial [Oscillibacter sp.]|nr:hypothetical protein [Oscillibacter sp.]